MILFLEAKNIGHLEPSNFKDMSKEIGHIFDSLEHVADYSIRPMPKIAMQAVQVVFWVSLVIATLDNSWKNINNFGNHTQFLPLVCHMRVDTMLDIEHIH